MFIIYRKYCSRLNVIILFTVCFEIEIRTTSTVASAMQWFLGECSNTSIYTFNSKYTEKCCLEPGIHTLMCSNSNSKLGWEHGYMKIGEHIFCDDIQRMKLMQALKIFGTCRYCLTLS